VLFIICLTNYALEKHFFQPQKLDWILARHQINHNAYLHGSYSALGKL
jgi:hypothetical protein